MAATKKTAKKTASKSVSNVTVEFVVDRDTKNTRRYAEVVEGDATPVIGTLYVRSSAFKTMPDALTVIISAS